MSERPSERKINKRENENRWLDGIAPFGGRPTRKCVNFNDRQCQAALATVIYDFCFVFRVCKVS